MKNPPKIHGITQDSATRLTLNATPEIIAVETDLAGDSSPSVEVTSLKRTQDKVPVIAYSSDDLVLVNSQTIYRETFEFKLSPTRSISTTDQLFQFNYWGKANQTSDQRITEGFIQVAQDAIKSLEEDWYQATCCFTVPENVKFVRAFEITVNDSDTTWDTIDIRNSRIEKYRDILGFYLKFTQLIQGTTELVEMSGAQQKGKLNNVKIEPDKEFGSCAVFDGKNSYINFETPQVPVQNEPYTLEVWIKPDDMANRCIFGWGDPMTNNSANLLNLTLKGIRNSADQRNVAHVAEKKLNDNQWHHVAATFDGNTCYVYIDGERLATDEPPQRSIASQQNFKIGKSDFAQLQPFQGRIALVRIWGRVLTPEEILRYQQLDKLNYATSPADPNLQLHLRFNELRQGLKPGTQEVQDYSGYERHGLINAGQPAPEITADDRFGSCLTFKSTSSPISVNPFPALKENTSFTIELSVKSEREQADATILKWGEDLKIVQKGQTWELILTQNNQNSTFDSSTSLGKIADGYWHQIAIVFNHQFREISVFFDQVWVASKCVSLGTIRSQSIEIAPSS